MAGRSSGERTWQVSSMNGDGWSRSKCAAACSCRTLGANGRNASRFLTRRFSRSRMPGSRGSAEDAAGAERARARTPWRRGTSRPPSRRPAGPPPPPAAPPRGRGSPAPSRPVAASSSRDLVARSWRVPGRRRAGAPGGGRAPVRRAWASAAAPSAPPASPAAGCTNSRSNGPSRRMRPLATQLSATPPAMQRFVEGTRSCEPARLLEQDLLEHHLQAARDVLVEAA